MQNEKSWAGSGFNEMIRKAQAQINQPLDKILNESSSQNTFLGPLNTSESRDELNNEMIDKRV